jgi:hypothetical protein
LEGSSRPDGTIPLLGIGLLFGDGISPNARQANLGWSTDLRNMHLAITKVWSD